MRHGDDSGWIPSRLRGDTSILARNDAGLISNKGVEMARLGGLRSKTPNFAPSLLPFGDLEACPKDRAGGRLIRTYNLNESLPFFERGSGLDKPACSF